jgi:hypothetical protein
MNLDRDALNFFLHFLGSYLGNSLEISDFWFLLRDFDKI